MIGLYYLPLPTLMHETGLSLQAARKALRRGSEGGFAFYDEDSETVWIPEMARFQIGEEMKETDNRRQSVRKEALTYSRSVFYRDFVARYNEVFGLNLQAPPKPLRSPSEGTLDPGTVTGTRTETEEALGRPAAPVAESEFEQFYQAYPRKAKPADAKKAWAQVSGARPPLEELLVAVERQVEAHNDGVKFFPYPATWLRSHSWANEIPSKVEQRLSRMSKHEIAIARENAALSGQSLSTYLAGNGRS